MLDYKTYLENWHCLSAVVPFFIAMRKIINEQLKPDTVLLISDKSRKPRTIYELIIKSNNILRCHSVSVCRIFFSDKLGLEKNFEVMIHILKFQIVSVKAGQEIISEEEMIWFANGQKSRVWSKEHLKQQNIVEKLWKDTKDRHYINEEIVEVAKELCYQ